MAVRKQAYVQRRTLPDCARLPFVGAPWRLPTINCPGQPLSHPCDYAWLQLKEMPMNFDKTENIPTEPWWVTILGCLAFAALFALALLAV